MKRICAAFLLLGASQVCGDEFNFPFPYNRLGMVDGGGRFSKWINGNWEVGDESLSLPLRFHFSPAHSGNDSSTLGEGWWVPLLESNLVQENDYRVRLTTLGGQTAYIYRNPHDETHFRNQTESWSGYRSGDVFELDGVGGWHYTYHRGRIAKAVSPEGRQFKWRYQSDGKVDGISMDGRPVLDVVRLQERVSEFRVSGGETFLFRWQDYPIYVSGDGLGGIIATRDSVEVIEISRGGGSEVAETIVEQSISVDRSGVYTAVGKRRGPTGGLEDLAYRWEGDTLLRDARSRYEVRAINGGVPLISRYHDEGGTESYMYDSKTRVESVTDIEGRLSKRYFIATPGPNFMRVRKTEEFREDGSEIRQISERAFNYSEDGRLSSEVNNGKRTIYRYLSEAELPSNDIELVTLAQDFGAAPGKIIVKVYDDTSGRLMAESDPSGLVRVFGDLGKNGRQLKLYDGAKLLALYDVEKRE